MADIEESAKEELRIQQQLRRKKEQQRNDTKEHIEEYRFRKEMDKQREKMVENMEKNKQKEAPSTEQQERIRKREQEMWAKKHVNIQNKQMQQLERQARLEAFKNPTKIAEGLKYKVESKLLVETKAQQEKKREKYDPKKDGPGRDAMTMGGNLLGMQIRSQPGWRAGM